MVELQPCTGMSCSSQMRTQWELYMLDFPFFHFFLHYLVSAYSYVLIYLSVLMIEYGMQYLVDLHLAILFSKDLWPVYSCRYIMTFKGALILVDYLARLLQILFRVLISCMHILYMCCMSIVGVPYWNILTWYVSCNLLRP